MANNKVILPSDWINLPVSEIAGLSPIQEVQHPLLKEHEIKLFLRRDDLLDAKFGGNKIFKLLHHLKAWNKKFGVVSLSSGVTQPSGVIQSSDTPIATFGGAFSNHLYALARVGQLLGIKTVGVIRGEKPNKPSHTLSDLESMGMKLCFVSRTDYKRRQDPQFHHNLEDTFQLGACYWVPEGGGGIHGALGCSAIGQDILRRSQSDYIVHACGTGTSLAGIIAGIGKNLELVEKTPLIIGVSVLKGYENMGSDVRDLCEELGVSNSNWAITHDYHCGGYAKCPEYLRDFIVNFYRETQILLDPVYTGKMMWAIFEQIRKGVCAKGKTILAVHSGGLQGVRGYPGLVNEIDQILF